MKIKTKITALLASLTFLASCKESEEYGYHHTVGEENNAITLMAGISEGGAKLQTRSAVDGNHAKHVAFSTEHPTQLRLRVDGTWRKSGSSTVDISYATTATTGSKTGTDNLHNKLSFSPVLYWDDYGTADPENMSLKDASNNELHSGNGRDKGLTIYGVAVNEKSLPTSATDGRTALSTLKTSDNFKNIAWNVGKVEDDAIDQSTNGWGDYDLLTSNNIHENADGTLKFQEWKDKTNPSDILEFTHAMTKITVNLTAGEGFPGYETSADDAKFQSEPKVTLLNFNYTGTVDVENKTSTPPTSTTTANIKAWINEGASWTSAHTAQATAIVFPGNSFTAAIASDGTATSTPNILKLEADGNVFYITAAQLVKAIVKKENSGADPAADTYTRLLKQGVNYILNIKVNKTKIEVTATIKEWDEIDTDEAAPVIDISASYGQTTGVSTFDKTYDFFRSTTIASGYDEDNTANGINPAATFTYNTGSYTQSKVLYWPNHNTHYFFRGVYPVIGTNSTGYTSEKVLAISTNSSSQEVIEVSNVAYDDDTWPSDLAIALPRTTNTACTNHSKTPLENGICATKGTITMNFEYAMSKVEVRLKSSANDTDPEYVDLSNITVEVVGGYNQGRITLEDGLHDAWNDTSDKGNYTLHEITAVSGFQKTTLDAIIPQTLDNDVKFKITVTNSDGTTDIYYAQLNQIQGKKKDAADSTKDNIKEWKHGEYYVYELTITKTEIKVTATITPWTEVTANQPVWF